MKEIDLLVIGAGPAGLGAAIEAGRYGASVIIVDDQDKPGGQLFKQIHKFFGSKEHQASIRGFQIGQELLAEAGALGIEINLSTKVTGIFDDKIVSLITDDENVSSIKPRKIVLATGGAEKALTFPGWTLPGVITAGAAQTLCNIERVLPGKRIVMIGSGNVGLIVSYQLLQAGAEVAALIEAGNKIGGYAVHAAKIKRAGIPIIMGHTIISAKGKNQVEEIEIIALDKNWNHIPGSEKSFKADTICLAVGLNPDTRLARLAGCRMEYYPSLGGFLPLHDVNMESSINGIFVAGDLAGIEEANTALDEGRLAGISSAASLGYIKKELFPELRKEIWGRLGSLRDGSLGAKRLSAKRELIGEKEVHTDLSDINTPDQPADYTLKDFQESPGFPSENRIKRGAVACIECAQEIPCNPCVDSCPSGAIIIKDSITKLPFLDQNRCTGCGLCLASCPGQAIFLLNYHYSDCKASVSFPYEYLPLPNPGETVMGVNRDGKPVAPVEIIKVDNRKRNDHTAIITVAVDKIFIHDIRSIKRGVRK